MNQEEIDKKFISAAKEGDLEEVKQLHNMGANVNACNDWALRWASEKGHLKVVEYLVKNGADIHALGDWALRWAAEDGHLKVVKYLVENGADYEKAKLKFEDLPTESKIFFWRKEIEGEL